MSVTAKFILVLPCEGAPYVWKNELFTNKGKMQKQHLSNEISKVVRGGTEKIDPTMMRIHPMFENRWCIANILRQRSGVELYGNENGRNEFTPNMACLRVVRDVPSPCTMAQYHSAPLKVSRVPYFGELALVVSEKTMKAVVKDIQSLFLVRVIDYYPEMGIQLGYGAEPQYTEKGYMESLEGYIFEPEDSAESKKFKTFAVAKGWGLDTFGHTYMKKTGRPDEKQSADYDSDSDEEDGMHGDDVDDYVREEYGENADWCFTASKGDFKTIIDELPDFVVLDDEGNKEIGIVIVRKEDDDEECGYEEKPVKEEEKKEVYAMAITPKKLFDKIAKIETTTEKLPLSKPVKKPVEEPSDNPFESSDEEEE